MTLQDLIDLAAEHNVSPADCAIEFKGFMGAPHTPEPDGTTIATSEDGSAVILLGAGI